MAKSNTKALEENSALRCENKRLREQIASLEAKIAEMSSRIEVNADGMLHM